MTAVFKHELRSYFHSLTAYVFGAFLLAFIGIGAMLYNLQAAVSNFEYVLSFASLVFVVIVPVLTMRVLAEERRQKTDQLLYSLPITTVQIIAGKYLALLVLYLIPLAIIAVYPLIFAQFGDVYLLTSYGSILAFFLLGAALIAVGVFLSSLTDNQGLAAGLGIAVILLNYYSVSLSEYVSSTPVGALAALLVLILAVMPWNFPVWQVMRGAVPILLAGNSYLLKHAPNVMGSAGLLGEIFAAAGLPDGVFGWVNATNDGVSQIINDDRIAAVTVTGSVRAGKAIGAQAGAALKKCVLELGGSDPFIVLNDADLDEAVKAAVTGRYQNSGQVCAASKRFILEAGIAEAFTRKFVDAVAALKMGDPRDEQNYVGPMARFDLRDELHQQVTATLDEGATLLLGAEKIEGAGNYYAPTVLGNVTAGMTGFRQELFGPVATLTTARDADHALALANDSEFGLSATVYTTDEAQAQRFARELECGGVFLNGYCASDARVAFGGVKKSGFGRELSHFGLHEFCNAQTVWKDRR